MYTVEEVSDFHEARDVKILIRHFKQRLDDVLSFSASLQDSRNIIESITAVMETSVTQNRRRIEVADKLELARRQKERLELNQISDDENEDDDDDDDEDEEDDDDDDSGDDDGDVFGFIDSFAKVRSSRTRGAAIAPTSPPCAITSTTTSRCTTVLNRSSALVSSITTEIENSRHEQAVVSVSSITTDIADCRHEEIEKEKSRRNDDGKNQIVSSHSHKRRRHDDGKNHQADTSHSHKRRRHGDDGKTRQATTSHSHKRRRHGDDV